MVAQAAPYFFIKDGWVPVDLRARLRAFNPRSHLGQVIKSCFKYLPPLQAAELLESITASVIVESELRIIVIRTLDSPFRVGKSLLEDWGVVSRKQVTTAGVNAIVDAFQNTKELENFKYHALGTDATAEATAQTGCIAELTTQYNPDSTRATGTTTENAANIYETVATNTLDAGATVQEHAVMYAATGATECLDRHVTGGQVLAANDGIQSTYRMTYTAGG